MKKSGPEPGEIIDVTFKADTNVMHVWVGWGGVWLVVTVLWMACNKNDFRPAAKSGHSKSLIN